MNDDHTEEARATHDPMQFRLTTHSQFVDATTGVAKEMGPSAFTLLWTLKSYANTTTGVIYPSVRALREATGMANDTIIRCRDALIDRGLLRIAGEGKDGRPRYLVVDELKLRLGDQLIATIRVDYIPALIALMAQELRKDLPRGKLPKVNGARIELIPGPGMTWDEATKRLTGRLDAQQLDASDPEEAPEEREQRRRRTRTEVSAKLRALAQTLKTTGDSRVVHRHIHRGPYGNTGGN